jgi:hemoglobin
MEDLKKEDLKLLIQSFYGKLMESETIGHHFTNVDWEHHMPRMVAFWSFVLFDETGYTSNLFQIHKHMQLTANDFEIWLITFQTNIDAQFRGIKADKAKREAMVIAYGMKSKLVKDN